MWSIQYIQKIVAGTIAAPTMDSRENRAISGAAPSPHSLDFSANSAANPGQQGSHTLGHIPDTRAGANFAPSMGIDFGPFFGDLKAFLAGPWASQAMTKPRRTQTLL